MLKMLKRNENYCRFYQPGREFKILSFFENASIKGTGNAGIT